MSSKVDWCQLKIQNKIKFLTLGCQDAYYHKSAAVPLLTNTTQPSLQIKFATVYWPTTGCKMSLFNTVRMSISATTPGGWGELALRRQKTKTAYAKCVCLQARHAAGPRLPSMRILFPASFMLQPAGNSNYVELTCFNKPVRSRSEASDVVTLKTRWCDTKQNHAIPHQNQKQILNPATQLLGHAAHCFNGQNAVSNKTCMH